MIHGALKDALLMRRGSKVFKRLIDQRMYDVVEHHKHHQDINDFNKEMENHNE